MKRYDDERYTPRRDAEPLPEGWEHRKAIGGAISRSEYALCEFGNLNGRECIAARVGLLDELINEQPAPSIEWAWKNPRPVTPTVDYPWARLTDDAGSLRSLPVRAPIRRERSVRWQSAALLVTVALGIVTWGFIIAAIERAIRG